MYPQEVQIHCCLVSVSLMGRGSLT
jgi:hypothetical protein